MSLAALRGSREQAFVFLARARDVIEYGAEDMHPVIDVDEVHHRHNEQGHAPIGRVPGGAGKPRHGRAQQEVRERPFVAGGPEIVECGPPSQNFGAPQHRYTQKLVAALPQPHLSPLIPSIAVEQERIVI
jgi:hypothetical protein